MQDDGERGARPIPSAGDLSFAQDTTASDAVDDMMLYRIRSAHSDYVIVYAVDYVMS
jgi:hypothetical protein